MGFELLDAVDEETALRQYITCVAKRRIKAVGEAMSDTERADLVAQVMEFFKDGIEAVVVGAVDRAFAEDEED